MPVGLGWRAEASRLLTGPDRGGERARNVVAGQAVLGQFRGRSRHREPLLLGQQSAHRAVQPGPLAGEQVRVDGFPQQRVPEDVAFHAVGHEQLVRDRLTDRGLVFVGRQAGRGADELVVGPPSGDRRRAEYPLRGIGQLFHPAEQKRRQPGGQGAAFGRIAADERGEQFLRVIGVAFGSGHDVVQLDRFDPARRRRHQMLGQGRRQMLSQGRGNQRGEIDRGDAGQPEQFGHYRPERVPPVQVVGPVGADQRDPFPVQHAGQERDQVPGGGIGPVQVLEHQEHRGGRRELGEQAEHTAEHLLPGQAGTVFVGSLPVAAFREQPAQGGAGAERVADPGGLGGAAQRVGQRQVGHAVAQLGALAGEHGEAASLGEPGHLADQPGLTNPGVPADQRDHRAAGLGVVEQREQTAEFVVPPDHPPGRHP